MTAMRPASGTLLLAVACCTLLPAVAGAQRRTSPADWRSWEWASRQFESERADLGVQLRAILNCPYPFVLCMGCDELGYILPRRYASNRNYEYENSMSVGPDTADIMLDQIRRMVREEAPAGE